MGSDAVAAMKKKVAAIRAVEWRKIEWRKLATEKVNPSWFWRVTHRRRRSPAGRRGRSRRAPGLGGASDR